MRAQLQAAYDRGLRSVAIVFMHGYRYTAHEAQAAALAQELGFTQISTSHQTSPLMKFVSRGDTDTVIPRDLLERTWSYLHNDAGSTTTGGRGSLRCDLWGL